MSKVLLDTLLSRAVEDRRWLRLLVAANLMGSLYGFWWYADQLAATPWVLWPWTADSPLSTFFLTGVLVLWAAGRRLPALEALAFFGLVKYGFWTVLVLGLWWAGGAPVGWVDAGLVLTHTIMVLQGLVFVRRHRLGAGALGFALAWYAWNDFLDYAAGYHPHFPDPGALPLIRAVALASTPFIWWLLGRGVPADAGRGQPGSG